MYAFVEVRARLEQLEVQPVLEMLAVTEEPEVRVEPAEAEESAETEEPAEPPGIEALVEEKVTAVGKEAPVEGT